MKNYIILPREDGKMKEKQYILNSICTLARFLRVVDINIWCSSNSLVVSLNVTSPSPSLYLSYKDIKNYET